MANLLSYNTASASTENMALLANATLILGPMQTTQDTEVVGCVIADQIGTLYIDQSFDAENWDVTTPIAVAATANISGAVDYTAGAGQFFSQIDIVAPYLQARYVNGSTTQSVLRIFVSTL
jgi:hypothetical protein